MISLGSEPDWMKRESIALEKAGSKAGGKAAPWTGGRSLSWSAVELSTTVAEFVKLGMSCCENI